MNGSQRYKGAFVQYKCEDCNICDSFEEDFKSENSTIKSDSCPHFSLKSLYNYEGDSFKYILSFTCNDCGKNQLINVFESITEKSPSIHYKCVNCGKGSMNIAFLLINNEKIKIYRTKGEDENNKKVYRTNDGDDSNEDNYCIFASNNINKDLNMKNLVIGGAQLKTYKTPNEINKTNNANINNPINKNMNGNYYPNNLGDNNKPKIYNGEINLIFYDIKNKAKKFKIKASSKDTFKNAMKKLLDENSHYIDAENLKNFLFNDKTFNKDLSLEKIGIKDGDEISMEIDD